MIMIFYQENSIALQFITKKYTKIKLKFQSHIYFNENVAQNLNNTKKQFFKIFCFRNKKFYFLKHRIYDFKLQRVEY